MIADYNHQAARSFVQALREGEREIAFALGLEVTNDTNAVNYGISPPLGYNDTELADLIEVNLEGIDRGRWDMTNQVHLPIVIGAICHWVTAYRTSSDGEISSESLEQGQEHEVTGT